MLKGTWKDIPAPANGLTYDLGAHLIDQSLVLFGRPTKLTAFVENVRGIGSKDVDDNFTIFLQYPPQPSEGLQLTSLTVILRAHILSARASQVRYVVRGMQGTYLKSGVDVQEDQLKAMPGPATIVEDATYGLEPERLWGTIESVAADGSTAISTWPSLDKGDYSGLFVDLALAIREGKEQAVKWAESAEVIELIELAYQSAKEERTITLPPRHS